MKYKIYNQDIIEWCKTYDKAPFHALLTDTPYNLDTITKRFGKNGSAPAKYGKDGVFQRSSKGFMNSKWDTDIAFQSETWELLGKHLYPGAFGFAFSGSRTWHRMAVAIEDAGFIIHPTIFGWLNGQGFPKATNISKQLHKQGNEDGMWEGHRYGLQALKPAVEPIIVFQKPYEGRPLDNIVETGAGALNIDGARIPTNEQYQINRFEDGMKPFGNGAGHPYKPLYKYARKGGNKGAVSWSGLDVDVSAESSPLGRWPANFILDESVAGKLDEQSGYSESKVGNPRGTHKKGMFANSEFNKVGTEHTDSGGASRFFFNVQEQIDEADPIYYCGKVSPKERNAGLDDMPTKNIHPTVKPIALAKYLATLLLPPEEYAPRRILVPFSGVGSEMIGAALAGWEQIVGIEFDTENGYVDIAHKRIQYWTSK